MSLSDAEAYQSTAMNARKASLQEESAGGVRILFLGNSITLHGVLPEIGWLHCWGMAASAPEKDYVHCVTRKIEEETGRKADLRIINLASFERGFQEYNVSQLQKYVDFRPHYLIIAIGENVGKCETRTEQLAFREAFRRLVEFLMQTEPRPHTVIRGVFWPNEWKDEMMADVAREFQIPFAKADLGTDDSMMARGLYEHPGIQKHPNDAGMSAIAQRILEKLGFAL